MKRSLRIKHGAALLLAASLLLAISAPAYCAEPGYINFQNRSRSYEDGMFSDVPESWYSTYVAAVYELGLMQGDTDGRFRPDDGVTLAETAALAARIHSIYFGRTADFTQGQPWYQVYFDYCRENGILSGESAMPDAAAKRSEFAGILSRTLPESALPAINDVPDGGIPDVAAGDADAHGIYLLYRAGILTGNDDYGTFRPDTGIRRSEVSAVVSRMAYRSLRKNVTLLPKPPYPDLPECEPAEDSYFSDAAMLGNSLVDGMMFCSELPMKFFGKQSGTVRINRVSELVQKQYGKVYIQLGINDLGGDLDAFINGYRSIIETIRAAMPEADIYIMAVTPVTQARSAEGIFTMKKICAMNDALYALAEEMECWYLDCCTPLCGDDGYLVGKYAGWDGSPHLDASGYLAWAEVIRTHCAPDLR